tara:strand:+ start:718 stop:1833 length:1116 start_codon:yes stop_codon:yes gene_type:complete
MTNKLLYLSVLGITIGAWQLTPIMASTAHAEAKAHADQKRDSLEDEHSHENDHDETDSDEHKDDHSEEKDKHDDHGHENHKEKEDKHDEHGHSGEQEEHEESSVEITPDAAKLTGIKVKKAGPGIVAITTPLTGRITLNENTTSNVRARFPGFVRAVHVNLGDAVKKGQKLATVESNESLNTYHVTAPMDGVVLKRDTNIGDVTNGKELFVIADLTTVWAKYHIFPRDVSNIKKGQSVMIHALDEKTQQSAQVSMLFPTTDALSQTVIAIAELSNKDGIWRPGMTIEGDIKIGERNTAISVPRTSLQFLEEEQVIFVRNGNKYEPRPVTIGMIGTDNVEITSGLEHGETYVSAGSFVVKADILKGTAAHSH